MSDTFFQALLSLKEEHEGLKWWLFRVCKNLWLDGLRRQKHFGEQPTDWDVFPAGQTYGHVDAPNPVQYPLFNLSTLHSNQDENPLSITDFPEPNGFEKYKAAGFELHFTSMLRYLADRPAATNALVHSSQDPQSDFAGALSYVEENGVRIYGALVYGKPSALLDLCDSDGAQYVSLVKVLPSRYSAAYGAR